MKIDLISVVISSPDSKTRFKEVSNMFNYSALILDKDYYSIVFNRNKTE